MLVLFPFKLRDDVSLKEVACLRNSGGREVDNDVEVDDNTLYKTESEKEWHGQHVYDHCHIKAEDIVKYSISNLIDICNQPSSFFNLKPKSFLSDKNYGKYGCLNDSTQKKDQFEKTPTEVFERNFGNGVLKHEDQKHCSFEMEPKCRLKSILKHR